MSQNVAEFVWKRLSEWGLSRVYGYPGDGVGGLDVALEKAKDFMDYVQVRHEEMAAFMASAHAKFTGQPGLCYATSGPGAIHLLTGLYDAKADHMPVVAIVGQQARSALGASYQQEVDLQTLFADVTEYVITAVVPEQVRTCIDRAVRIAQAKRAVTCVDHPQRSAGAGIHNPPMVHGATHTGVGYPGVATLPGLDDLKIAAEILNKGKKIAILVGAGALHATDEVIAIANCLNAGVAKALLGKAAVPDDLPFVTGSLGLLGTKPSWDLMKGCDTFLMVGSAFPYSEFLPKPGNARGVQIDIDGANVSLRYPMDYSLIGDSKQTLAALLPLLEQNNNIGWREGIEKNVAEWWETLKDRAMEPADPVNPQRIFHELSPRLPEDVIMTGDSGSVANWYARDIKIRRGMMGSLSGGLGFAGSSDALRLRGQDGLSASPRDRLHRRRRDADERSQRDDHGEQILAALVRSTLHHHGAQQSRPQPGDLGRAHTARRRQDAIDAVDPRLPIPQICRADRAQGHLLSTILTRSVRHGMRRWHPTGRSS